MPLLIPEKYWAVMTIRQEADNQSFQGKVAVAEVIRNRVRTRYQSDGTIAGTVLKPYQFSGWNTDDPNRIRIARIDDLDPLTVEAIRAYETAFGTESNIVSGANLYHTLTMKVFPSWSKSDKVSKVAIVGKHIFYKDES